METVTLTTTCVEKACSACPGPVLNLLILVLHAACQVTLYGSINRKKELFMYHHHSA
jgi:hypothetical protein